jgi:pimeloyl-ACP methyl ester carboxylesterase
MVGISGGGTVTTFTAATDRRVAAAVVCGYICTFHGSILAMPHCLCNFIPGLLKWAEMHDVAGLIAPRPLLVVSGTKDPIFPIKATRAACREIRRIYETLGAADRFSTDFFDGPHRWEGRAVVPFLNRWL